MNIRLPRSVRRHHWPLGLVSSRKRLLLLLRRILLLVQHDDTTRRLILLMLFPTPLMLSSTGFDLCIFLTLQFVLHVAARNLLIRWNSRNVSFWRVKFINPRSAHVHGLKINSLPQNVRKLARILWFYLWTLIASRWWILPKSRRVVIMEPRIRIHQPRLLMASDLRLMVFNGVFRWIRLVHLPIFGSFAVQLENLARAANFTLRRPIYTRIIPLSHRGFYWLCAGVSFPGEAWNPVSACPSFLQFLRRRNLVWDLYHFVRIVPCWRRLRGFLILNRLLFCNSTDLFSIGGCS